MDLTQYLKTRARACRVAAEGADVMVTQSRGGVRWSECFQIRCLESAVRLERRDGEVTRGCCSIDTVPTVSAIAAAPRDANFDVLGFCGGIRASVSVLRSSKSALTRLGLGTNRAQIRSLRYVTVLSPRLCCGGRVRTGNPPLIESTLLQLSCPLEVPIGHECQLCLVLAI
jgi:hypothetical protein